MGSNHDLLAAERLERLFSVIADEARARPDFALRLNEALEAAFFESENAPEGIGGGGAFSLVAVLHTEGEQRLRECLAIVPAGQLLQLAEEQHIPVDPKEAGGPAPVIIDAIVEGVKFRLADRLAAAL